MGHPFLKMFEGALRKSTEDDNVVLREVLKLKQKGYSVSEIHAVLLKLEQGLIDDGESGIVKEAREEFERYLE